VRPGGGSGAASSANSIVTVDWVSLRDHQGEIERGAVFRLPAQWPYEETTLRRRQHRASTAPD